VRGDYNFTGAGLRNADQRGITPAEVFEIIDSTARLFSRAGDQSMLILGVTTSGRHIVILGTEADLEPDVWDIVAARVMTDRETSNYRKVRGGNDA
jgi:uncharacterized DUF497 family protein